MRLRPHLRTVFLLVNLLILLLPIGGIAVLRIYESELIRLTESELIAQGAFVSALFRDELLRVLNSGNPGTEAPDIQKYGVPVDPRLAKLVNPNEPLRPLQPKLDLARDRVRPPAPPPELPDVPADRYALAAAERLNPMLHEASLTTLAGIRVTDFRGVVVGSTRGETGMSLLSREEIHKALTGRHASLLRDRILTEPAPPLASVSRRGRVRVFVAMPVVHGDRVLGVVALSRTALDIPKALYQNRRYLVLGASVIVVVVILVSLLTSLTISRPVTALIRQAEQVSKGERSAAVPLAKPGTYEVDRLSRALAEMSLILEKRADYIRAFASNVSHEFKTPLTSMRGTVEILRDHFDQMTADEKQRFFGILEEDTERLGRLVGRLLDLARADVVKPGTERTRILQILENVAERYRGGGMPVALVLDPHVETVSMAPETFESIISNLLDNARQHGGEEVSVTLATKARVTDSSRFVDLIVSDTGKGISRADEEKVFRPFFTTARSVGGTGLGLSIVQALVAAHGGTIALEPSTSGTRFRVTLPL